MAMLQSCVTPMPVDPDATPDPTALISTSLVQTAMVDGVRSTTVTWPDEMSTVTYPTLPQPPANCRITRMVYRTFKLSQYTQSMGAIEGQERYYIYTAKGLVPKMWAGIRTDYHAMFIKNTTTFRYDATGRLVEEITHPWNLPNDTTSYTYEPGRILYNSSYWDGKRLYERGPLPLDSRGLSGVHPQNYRYGFYDSQGYLVLGNWNAQDPQYRRIKGRVSNGDYAEVTDSLSDWGETRLRYLQYVNRPNVPNNKPFYGKQSSQLLAQKLLSIRSNAYYRDGDKYLTRYMYLFDVQGRVRRTIVYGISLDPAWPFEEYTEDVGMIDYEYACP